MVISKGENSVDKIVDYLKGDLEFSPVASVINWALCVLMAVSVYVLFFCGRRVGGLGGGRTIYEPTAEFVMNAVKYAFPAFVLFGIVGFVSDRNKTIALRVIIVAAFCTFLCWYKTLLL